MAQQPILSTRRSLGTRIIRDFRMNKWKYLMILPVLVYLALFAYKPMYGLQIAFKNYRPTRGIAGSAWVGFQWFEKFFTDPYFWRLLRNTFTLSALDILFGFPAPILLALLLNELRNNKFKRTVQTISYLPHFVSWIIISAILYSLINGSYGLLNNMMKGMGIRPPSWYTRPDLWRGILVGTEIWKSIGFSSILYLAAIANINSELYEAAAIDGATRFKQTLHITLPSILPTVIVMFILQMGGLMSGNFQQVYALVGNNTAIYRTVDTLDYYIYRVGIGKTNFSLGTAMGIFQSIISFLLVLATNRIANRAGSFGIW